MAADASAGRPNRFTQRMESDPFYSAIALPRWLAYCESRGWAFRHHTLIPRRPGDDVLAVLSASLPPAGREPLLTVTERSE